MTQRDNFKFKILVLRWNEKVVEKRILLHVRGSCLVASISADVVASAQKFLTFLINIRWCENVCTYLISK